MANFEDFLNLILWQEKRNILCLLPTIKVCQKMTFADKDFLFLFINPVWVISKNWWKGAVVALFMANPSSNSTYSVFL